MLDGWDQSEFAVESVVVVPVDVFRDREFEIVDLVPRKTSPPQSAKQITQENKIHRRTTTPYARDLLPQSTDCGKLAVKDYLIDGVRRPRHS